MRRLLPLVALACLLAPGAEGATSVKTIGTRGKVVSISADGGRVAIHSATGVGRSACNAGSVWTPAAGRVVRFADNPCGKKAFDLQYDGLTIAGDRVAWTDYDFGNHAYCRGPFTATLAKPAPQSTGACPEDPDNEDLYWELKGDGSLLVARSYVRCDYSCPPDYTGKYDADVTIWRIGSDAHKLLPVKKNTKLFDVDAGRILLRDATKGLVVLDATGKQVGTIAPPERGAAFMSGPDQVVGVSKGTTLSIYDVSTGEVVATSRMKGEGKLMDVENGVAAYFSATEVRLLTLATGRDRLVARQKGLVQADLEPTGLFYAYNVPGGGAKPGRVTFVAASALPK